VSEVKKCGRRGPSARRNGKGGAGSSVLDMQWLRNGNLLLRTMAGPGPGDIRDIQLRRPTRDGVDTGLRPAQLIASR
jgi:hypothetical protein